MRKGVVHLIAILFLSTIGLVFLSGKNAVANNEIVYSDGIYRYIVTSHDDREVDLIGLEATYEMEELYIPATTIIKEMEYKVDRVNFRYDYYDNEDYSNFYNSVSKIIVAEGFTGILNDSSTTYYFPNLKHMEFKDGTPPKEVSLSLSNRDIRDILFIVPKGSESAYSKVIDLSINYYMSSDLYEQDIILKPTIVTRLSDDIEYGYFDNDEFVYKVIEPAKDGSGKVELVGITHLLKRDYIALPSQIENNGYRYELTALGRFALVGSGARAIVIPNTVTKMAGGVFDSRVELLFLSENCKEIPYLISDENDATNLRFVYVPEGVTTISDNAFNNSPNNKASIILPTTIKQVGKGSLYTFESVTFLNKKPLDNIKSAINKDTTVKVHESSISSFKKVLGNNASVVAAKNIKKAIDITVNKESLLIGTIKTTAVTAKLTKGSNEGIYWLSTNPDIVEVSSKGLIKPRKAGTAYVIAYTRTSGRHRLIKVTVTETTFIDGIFTYRITDSIKKTVSVCQIRPRQDVNTLNIPETVKYKNIKYTVTGVGVKLENTGMPIIPEGYSNNKIKRIIFPKTITENVGYLGRLKHLESITFKGKKALDFNIESQ